MHFTTTQTIQHLNTDKPLYSYLLEVRNKLSANYLVFLEHKDHKWEVKIEINAISLVKELDSVSWQRILKQTNNESLLVNADDFTKAETAALLKSDSPILLLLPISIEQMTSCLVLGFANLKIAKQAHSILISDNLEPIIKNSIIYLHRISTLIDARQASDHANIEKSRFIANMSHELRTPLTAIMGYSQMLDEQVFGDLNSKQHDAIKSIIKSSQHLKQLIDEVLSLSRIESGKEEAKPEEVIVGELLSQCKKFSDQQALAKGLRFELNFHDESVKLAKTFVDPRHAKQIILNLLSNAIKYTQEGGLVSLSAKLSGKYVNVSISDNGIGIHKDKLLKLFQRFERGEDSYSQIQEGTGIGLNITNRLLELNKGLIKVESEEGKGAVFTVSLPLLRPGFRSASYDQSGERKKIRLDGLKALVLDDNMDTCTVLAHIIRTAGAEALTANSVQEALAIFNSNNFDIVLSDLAMPGASGIDFINAARSTNSKNPHIPILILSACAFDSDKNAVLQAGANAFMAKPFKPEEVLKQVKNLVKV